MAKFILGAVLALVLAGCGGGGGDAPTAAPPAHPVAGCTPKVVTVQLAGDSTQFGFDGATRTTALQTPGMVLQSILDARFGAGAVVVQDIGMSGTTSADLAPGALTADITVVNFGINDAVSMPIETYKALLRGLHPTVFETPSPTYRDIRPLAGTMAFAQAMREVAAETGTPVADVTPYVMDRPNWQAEVADEIHPDNALYAAIVTNVLAPTLEPMISKLRCQ
jgi:lysophospholipase L1-like esterase